LTDNDDAQSRKLNAAGLILRDAIADALDRLRQQMPGLTAEEAATVFERTLEVIRESEGWRRPEAPPKAIDGTRRNRPRSPP
jgi:hypothetical protein